MKIFAAADNLFPSALGFETDLQNGFPTVSLIAALAINLAAGVSFNETVVSLINTAALFFDTNATDHAATAKQIEPTVKLIKATALLPMDNVPIPGSNSCLQSIGSPL